MRTDEVVVARLKGGLGIGRFLGDAPAVAGRRRQVRVATGRNREARLPEDRVVFATGVIASAEDDLERFRSSAEETAAALDLAEVWEVVCGEEETLSLDDVAELHWGDTPSGEQLAAMLLHLNRSSLYFVDADGGYLPRPQQAVEETLARQRRAAENELAREELARHLADGALPLEPSAYQSELLSHLRGFAVHGENYTRNSVAETLLRSVDTRARDLQRLSFDTLVRVGVLAEDEPLELERADIRVSFAQDALDEAETLDVPAILRQPGRRDLTSLPAITIDDASTQDKDDALSLEVVSGDPTTVYRVGVHIADGGALVGDGGAMDREADARMSTLYLPELQVAMLPPSVSHRAGSLLPGEERAALSLLLDVTADGDVLDWEVTPSVIRSRAELPYEEADEALSCEAHPWHGTLAPLNALAETLRAKRERAGALMLDRSEMRVDVGEDGRVDVRVVQPSAAREMVAELMILANSLIAEFCRDRDIPAAYRSQKAPDLDGIPEELPDGPLRRFLTLRRIAPAALGTRPGTHAGLGLSAYLQATSPLRRYPDLVMQRQIGGFLERGEPPYSARQVTEVTQRADVQIRELGRLEEDRRRYWFLKFLGQRLQGDEPRELYDAVVLENARNRNALLELVDYPYRLRTKLPQQCEPGEMVTLRLHGVDLWRRVGFFVHAPHST